MSPKTQRIVSCLLIATILLAAGLVYSARVPTGNNSFPPAGFQSSFARASNVVQYNKQVGFTFTQDIASLSFNVTAVAQSGPDGSGPTYLLNGLSDGGYWYQVGLSYNWGSGPGGGYTPGFQGAYEVFDPYGISVFPTNGGGGAMTVGVNQGDNVQLSLSFSRSNVLMNVQDWQTGSTASQQYPKFGATVFVGDPSATNTAGFFTGLMTEQYYSSQDNSSGNEVVYHSSVPISSAWMWMDEFGIQNSYKFSVYENATRQPTIYGGETLQYFASNGIGVASNGQLFVTNLHDIVLPIASVELGQTLSSGSQNTVKLDISNSAQSSLILENATIALTNSGIYTDRTPVQVGPNQSKTVSISLSLPSTTMAGNQTLTVSIEWEQFDSNIQNNIILGQTKSSIMALVEPSYNPPASPPTPNPPSNFPTTSTTGTSSARTLASSFSSPYWLPLALGYVLLVVAALSLFFQQERRNRRVHMTG